MGSILLASVEFIAGCSAGLYQLAVIIKKKFFFISIYKPSASIRFAPIEHALVVTVEPFKFSPALPVAYELSHLFRIESLILVVA